MKRKGFTLIEMLVVMVIISILAAILFAVFSGVRNKAQQTKCLSHMRQIGMAIKMYASDHDDLPPQGAYDSPFLPPFMPTNTPQASTYRVDWQDILIGMGYVGSYQMFVCPASINQDYRSSYGVNRWLMGWRQSNTFSSIPYESYTAMISEKRGPDWPIWLPDEYANNPYYYPMDPRHNNRLNVLFADGSLRTVGLFELIKRNDIIWQY